MRPPRSPDTIFALSSGRLPAGVAVVRISGPASLSAVAAMSGPIPAPREMVLRSIRSRGGDLIDRGLLVVFPGGESFTGEDCAELHLHGGRAVVAAVSRELASLPGLRPADAGEFSLRAFSHGKFDLTTAEALADLIEAETEAQRRFAIQNASGRNASLYDRWRALLLQSRAMIEAELDFPEEEDVPGSVSEQAWHSVEELIGEIDDHLKSYKRSEIVREGFRVTIVGPPNAGKSSLLNTLADRDVAIVSDEPGTTRDLVEVSMDLGGLKVILTDTAGIREGAGPVEQEGIARARAAAARSDLVILLDEGFPTSEPTFIPTGVETLHVRSKIDLDPTGQPPDSRETRHDLGLSTRTGQGVTSLLDIITAKAQEAAGAALDPVPFRDRHVAELVEARAALDEFLSLRSGRLELAAEQLRRASDNLSRIVGTIDVEELLDAVFSRFCIGK